MEEADLKPSMRVCSRHFPMGDVSKKPDPSLGKKLCSPIKKDSRADRAKSRDERRSLSGPLGSISRSVSPLSASQHAKARSTVDFDVTPIGEQLQANITVHELPPPDEADSDISTVALKAEVEYLKSENKRLEQQLEVQTNKALNKPTPFRLEQIKHNDCLVNFYTGFTTFHLLLCFFDFLGPVVDKLNPFQANLFLQRISNLRQLHKKIPKKYLQHDIAKICILSDSGINILYEGRQISSLRIHVERAIGRLKNYAICKDTIPITLARLANQIVCVCAFLSNFQPALVPPQVIVVGDSESMSESDIDSNSEPQD